MTFDQLFKTATGIAAGPFDYQRRLACGEAPLQRFNDSTLQQSPSEWLSSGSECKSRLINIPTGCGKTAAVVLAWLWNRVVLPSLNSQQLVAPKSNEGGSAINSSDWPRRLVYCLPMRTLVEQTRDNVFEWLVRLSYAAAPDHKTVLQAAETLPEKAGERFESAKAELRAFTSAIAGASEQLLWLLEHSPVILMGGEEKTDWDLYPEREAILIGTQDMLLSRSLNRGYGMSRYRWPMHFGLLNNDCLWVLDEVQLMGSGLPTTTQLDAFRERSTSDKNSYCFWMSATLDRDWLKTVDFDPSKLGEALALSNTDREGDLKERFEAVKTVKHAEADASMTKPLADEIITTATTASGLTLVVVNTVRRACALHDEIKNLSQKKNKVLPLTLIHSRFRPAERKARVEELLKAEGKLGIVVSTQVVEAGVDISAEVLFTELAPWSSLVQRFGRCNRRGEYKKTARIVWINLNEHKPEFARPYETNQLTRARKRVLQLTDASPANLQEDVFKLTAEDKSQTPHVIRHKDLIELFDTTPDMAGNDIDIDRYVRETDDSSVHIFWREWEGKAPPSDMSAARREELCPALLGEFNDFVKNHLAKNHGAWRWDYLDREWSKADRIYPGQIYLLHAFDGGYSLETGWNPKDKTKVTVLPEPLAHAPEATDDDDLSQIDQWQSIAQHTDKVVRELSSILDALNPPHRRVLELAARWHDWGKAHEAFQAKLKPEFDAERSKQLHGEPMAKAPKAAWRWPKLGKKPKDENDKRRKFFRHELASALGVLHPDAQISGCERDLVAYLVAAHHGKVRLSIRSLPDEWTPPDGKRFARGVWDNDPLPRTFLGVKQDGTKILTPGLMLSLEPMELGLGEKYPFENQPSWVERMLHLRDTLGPFRLAFLETLLRAADQRASAMMSSTP